MAQSSAHTDRTAFTAVACGFALLVSQCQAWLLNSAVFPATSAVFAPARELQTLAGVLVGAAIVMAASRRPSWLKPAPLSVGSAASILAGSLLLVALPSSALGVTAGLVLVSLGASWCFYLLGAALGTLGTGRTTSLALVVGVFGAALVSSALPAPGYTAGVALRALIGIGSIALLYPLSRDRLQAIAHGGPGQELALANPRSFLEPTHQAYVLILVFSAAFGFALAFRIDAFTPVSAPARLVFLVAILGWFALCRDPIARSDGLFRAAATLVVGGLAVAPVAQSLVGPLSNALLYAGNYCFLVLYWLVLASLCARNPMGTLVFLGWGRMFSGIGTFIGADTGHLCNALTASAPDLAWLVTACAVTALFGYVVWGIRDFSFAATIEGVVPARQPEPSAAPATPGFEERLSDACGTIAQRHGITERERDVMYLLALGHSGQHIADALTLSYNTVKTHVKHVYAKTGVHSQQELIDAVYREAGL